MVGQNDVSGSQLLNKKLSMAQLQKNDEGNKYYGFTYRKTYRNHSYLEKCRVSCGGLP